ncbi:sedlin, N-terminal domain-containing protein [Encephalitozoon hellem]|nr:sedlin, N-terminal domain-containing protein [Encephalitozoon hellem]
MGELLVIISEKNDIVYQRMYSRASNEEYCRLMILIYGSIDILTWRMASTSSNYFDCLEKHGEMRISAYIMASGYKLLFIHSRKSARSFLEGVHRMFVPVLMSSSLEEEILESKDLDTRVDEAYRACF